MQVLLIRHAIAEDYNTFALINKVDDLRPLTEKGINKMCKSLQGLTTILSEIHYIVHSPLTRAMQTADLVQQFYPNAQSISLAALAPRGSASNVLTYLQEHANTHHTVALVGHEPSLGELGSWLLSGHTDTWLPLKKGGMCLLNFTEVVEEGQGDLQWLLSPKLLRNLK